MAITRRGVLHGSLGAAAAGVSGPPRGRGGRSRFVSAG